MASASNNKKGNLGFKPLEELYDVIYIYSIVNVYELNGYYFITKEKTPNLIYSG